MAEPDYYKILGISRNATEAQIKSAYRKLAKRYHPDRNRGDKTAENRFKQVQAAYEVLSSPDKRKIYDQFGRTDVGPGGPRGQRVYTWPSDGGPDVPIEHLDDLFSVFSGGRRPSPGPGPNIFDQFMGKMGGRRRSRRSAAPPPPERGHDVEHSVELPFLDAVHGSTLDLSISGRGPAAGQKISVKIPPGVADGQRIRIRGKGQPGPPGTPPGDLYIVCRIQPHPIFRREGNDIHFELPLTITEATLGTKVEIPTLDGKTVLTVPPGTPGGARLRLRHKGIRPAGGEPVGDQYAIVRIVPPKSLTPEQRGLIEKLHETDLECPRSPLGV